MPKVLAYLRTSTNKQDLSNQKLEILEYAHQHKMSVDDFIEISISSRKDRRARRIEELLQKLAPTIHSSSPNPVDWDVAQAKSFL